MTYAVQKKGPVTGEVENWDKAALIPRDLDAWNKTKTGITYSYSGFAGILYRMMAHEQTGELAWFTTKLGNGCIAGTDGRYLYINPPEFFPLPLKQRIFAVCHEIFHDMLDHPAIMHKYRRRKVIEYPDGSRLPYVESVMQCAADLIINAGLVFCNVGELIPGVYHAPQLVDHTVALLESYRRVYKETEGGQTLTNPQNEENEDQNQNKQGKGQDGKRGKFTKDSDPHGLGEQYSHDMHMRPGQGRGKTAAQAIDERNKTEWDAAITNVMHTMRSMGMGSSNIEKMFGKITEPEIDWTERLRTVYYRVMGQGRETWDFLDEEFAVRGIGAPGRLGYGAKLLITAQDSSGSISQSISDKFMGETSGIVTDIRPRELLLVQCDDKIHEWEYVDANDDLRRKLRRGFGGTSFVPVFERIEKEGLQPDALVYFTDTYGIFPSKAPPYPVIWCSIVENAKVPFGELIYIPLKKKGVMNYE
jgi:predicted metal-dependent peptidase